MRYKIVSIVAVAVAIVSISLGRAVATSTVNGADIQNYSITGNKLATGSVGGRAILDRSIGYLDLSVFTRGDLQDHTLISGRTVRGAIGGDFPAFATGPSTVCPNNCSWGAYASLPVPAPVGINDAHVLVNNVSWQDGGPGQSKPVLKVKVPDGNTTCTGTPTNPTAPKGYVCIYISGGDDAEDVAGVSVLFGTGASRYGFKLHWVSTGVGDANNTFIDATWAYTAP